MKKKYEKPSMEITELSMNDVIVASGPSETETGGIWTPPIIIDDDD